MRRGVSREVELSSENAERYDTPTRIVVPIRQVLRWFSSVGKEPPASIDGTTNVEFLEDHETRLFSPFFVCTVQNKRVVSIDGYPQRLDELLETPLPQHSPTYTFNETFFEMRKGFVLEQTQEPRCSNAMEVETEQEESARLVAHRVLRLLNKNFVRRETPGPNGETHRWEGQRLPLQLVAQLTAALEQTIESEPPLVALKPPVYVIGDLRGSYLDTSAVFEALQIIPNAAFTPDTFLLLGHILESGPHPLEVFALTAALKVLCPKNIFCLNPQLNWAELERTDFRAMSDRIRLIESVYAESKILATIMGTISKYPTAALIDNKILCVSEGIPKRLRDSPRLLRALATMPRKIYDDIVPINEGEGSEAEGWLRDVDVLAKTRCEFIIRGRRQQTRNVCVSKSEHMIFLRNDSSGGEAQLSAGLLVDGGRINIVILADRRVE